MLRKIMKAKIDYISTKFRHSEEADLAWWVLAGLNARLGRINKKLETVTFHVAVSGV